MIRLYCGPMFSGKTDKLLEDLNKLEESGKKVILLKPIIDTRVTAPMVVSRSGLSRECIIVNESEKRLDYLITLLDKFDIIGIDEAQFFSLDFIKILVNTLNIKGKTIIASGLDMDRFREPFDSVPYLISIAEEVEKLKAHCSDCKGKYIANTEYMDSLNTDLICIGDKEYLALCNECRTKRIKEIIRHEDLISLYNRGFLNTVVHNNELCEIVLFGDKNIICAVGNRLKCSMSTDETIFYKEGLMFDIHKNFL